MAPDPLTFPVPPLYPAYFDARYFSSAPPPGDTAVFQPGGFQYPQPAPGLPQLTAEEMDIKSRPHPHLVSSSPEGERYQLIIA